ncbi:MAG: glycosyltransferase, partial [Rickettsiales bacterium]
SSYIYVPFDKSMQLQGKNLNGPQKKIYFTLEEMYENRNPNHSTCSQRSIPKIIHQIWIGPRSIPNKYKKLSLTWKQTFPDWKYKLWTDKDVMQFQFQSKDLYNKASSYQEKSDILRYEILKKYGGLYVDMDYEALNNFDQIIEKYDFIGSVEPTHANNIAITNAIIASKPENPVFQNTLNSIRDNWHQVEKDIISELGKEKLRTSLIHLAVNRTMSPLKQEALKYLQKNKCAIIFPPSYFSIENRNKYFDKIRLLFGSQSKRLYFRTIQPETYARQLRGGKRKIDNLQNF